MDKLAIYIHQGIIALIEDDGEIGYYRQKGINDSEISKLIYDGLLDAKITYFQEIPDEYEIYFEDEEIMGIANKYFN